MFNNIKQIIELFIRNSSINIEMELFQEERKLSIGLYFNDKTASIEVYLDFTYDIMIFEFEPEKILYTNTKTNKFFDELKKSLLDELEHIIK